MESAGKRLRTRTDIGKDIERCLDDLKITHAELAEMLNVSDKTVDRMIGGKGPTTKYASALARDVDVMTAAFREFTGKTLNKTKKPSVRKKLQQAIAARSQDKQREREKSKEKQKEPTL